MHNLLDVLKPQDPPKRLEPTIIHTLDHGNLTPGQKRALEAKSAINQRNYEEMRARAKEKR